jgi:hypothetical protein
LFSALGTLLFEKTLGKAGLIALALAALFGWWQLELSRARQIGAMTERATATAKQTEAVHDELETADRVRADAQRAARGERVRDVRPDPYHDAKSAAPGR